MRSAAMDGCSTTSSAARSHRLAHCRRARPATSSAALGVKQALQLQTLIAAQYRAETTDRARSIVAQEEARQRFQQFLGDGRAYTPTR